MATPPPPPLPPRERGGRASCTFSARGIADGGSPCPAWVIPVVAGLCVALLTILKLLCLRRALRPWWARVTRGWLGSANAPVAHARRGGGSARAQTAAPAAVKPVQMRFDPRELRSVPLPDECADGVCVICLDALSERRVTAGKCAHYLHRGCLYNWLVRDPTSSCPICRAAFEVGDEAEAVGNATEGAEEEGGVGADAIADEEVPLPLQMVPADGEGIEPVGSGVSETAEAMSSAEVLAAFQRRWGLV